MPANTDGWWGTSDPISIATAGIKSVKFHDTGNFYVIDDLSYTPSGAPSGGGGGVIPEPTTLFLVSFGFLGFLGLGIRNRRKAKSVS